MRRGFVPPSAQRAPPTKRASRRLSPARSTHVLRMMATEKYRSGRKEHVRRIHGRHGMSNPTMVAVTYVYDSSCMRIVCMYLILVQDMPTLATITMARAASNFTVAAAVERSSVSADGRRPIASSEPTAALSSARGRWATSHCTHITSREKVCSRMPLWRLCSCGSV